MDDDLRRYKRLGWNRAGKVSASTGKILAHCFVKNISPNGARLLVAKPAAVPDNFKLQVRGAKLQPNCRVRWRRARRSGFNSSPEQILGRIQSASNRQGNGPVGPGRPWWLF
jgi:hypothetical protein